jgi:hypothetical protein
LASKYSQSSICWSNEQVDNFWAEWEEGEVDMKDLQEYHSKLSKVDAAVKRTLLEPSNCELLSELDIPGGDLDEDESGRIIKTKKTLVLESSTRPHLKIRLPSKFRNEITKFGTARKTLSASKG